MVYPNLKYFGWLAVYDKFQPSKSPRGNILLTAPTSFSLIIAYKIPISTLVKIQPKPFISSSFQFNFSLCIILTSVSLLFYFTTMPAGGFSTAPATGVEFEAKITPIVIISCIMAATGGLMFGYDVGVSGE